jgi:hypothetical protein
MSMSEKHIVMVIKPLSRDVHVQLTAGDAIITIDGVLVGVKVHRRAKDAVEGTDPFESPGTWTVMRFDKPEIKKHPDYKAIWKEVFFALKLNWNERDYVCENQSLQLEFTGKKQPGCGECQRCKARKAWQEETTKRLKEENKKSKGEHPELALSLEADEDGNIPF